MVDFGFKAQTEDKRKKKKRKFRSIEENGKISEAARVVPLTETGQYSDEEFNEEQRNKNKKFKQEGYWKELDIILFLRNNKLDLQRKLELALELVNSMKLKEDLNSDGGLQTVSDSRLIAFLNEWIQCRLITLNGKETVEGKKPQLEFRCWEILKFCLEKSLCLKVPLSFKPTLLRALSLVGTDALSILEEKESFILSERSELYSLISDCVSLIFSSHGRRFKADVGLWSEMVSTMLGVVHKIYLVKVSNDSVGPSLLRLSCLILEPFANLLRVNPNPKNIFRDFVKKLLEPLLSLLVMLNGEIDGSNSPWTINLLKTVEEILSNGLFHPTHVKEFLITQSTEKQSTKKRSTEKDIGFGDVKCFFEKLEKIMSEKKMSLGGVGELFRLFVIRVKKQKGVPVQSESIKMTGETRVSRHLAKNYASSASKISVGNGSAVSETTYSLNRLDMETGKSLFDNFKRYIEPLMLDIKTYSNTDLEVGPMLLNAAHCTLEATNKILAAFLHEQIYLRTEDTSDGVHLNFLKDFYKILISFSLEIRSLWLSGLKIDDGRPMEMLPLVVKEITVALGYFLEIEYEVVGDDLVSLWTTMFSYLAIDLSAMGTPERCSLASPILHLGCQLINIYSELRQVSDPIFALCKAVRLFVSCTHSLSSEACVKSVTMLLCFQDFRLAICKSIKSIPEGQASGCIRQLKMDISESLDWIKSLRDKGKGLGEPLHTCSTPNLNLRAELLGMALSEVYTIVLDHLAVTTGNSIVVGNSIKDLVKALGPSLSILVGKHLDCVNEFLFSVTGRRFSNKKKSRIIASWVSLFFFRIYVSCRSLYRQSISLMPPDSSKKASEAMGDFFTVYSGEDCMGRTEWRGEGYFSWIIKPSESLWTILQSVSDFFCSKKKKSCLQGTVAGYAPLVYVMHTMACQRLVDLNRQIKGLEFLKEGAGRGVEVLMDDASLTQFRKESEKWEEDISVLRQEAEGVTRFLLRRYLPKESIFIDACVTSEGEEKQAKHEDGAWDLGIPSLTDKSLPTAVWYLLCQNTDIWCPHATDKKLEKFLFLLFRMFLASNRGSCKDVIKHKMDGPHNLEEVTLHEISLELLRDTFFYEQTFLCRHLTSRFCCVLNKSVSKLFSGSWSMDVDFSDWLEVLSEHEKTPVVLLNRRQAADDEISALKPESLPSDAPSMNSKELTACESLLNLLCWMPKVYPNLESFSDYATYILNLERAVVCSFLDYHGQLTVHNQYERFRLFVCCRKALKSLLMAFCEEKAEVKQFSIIPIFSENSNSVLWLLKSVSALLRLLPAFPEDCASQLKYMSFSLMDHTSYLLLTLTKEQFCLVIPSLIYDEKPIAEVPISDGGLSKKYNLSESDSSLGAWMEHIAESLKEHAQMLLPNEKLNAGLNVVDLNNLSSIVSCFQGFLWGIASVLRNRYEKCNEETKLLHRWLARRSKLNPFMGFFEKFMNSCFHVLLVKDSRQHDGSYNDRVLEPDCEVDSSRLDASYRSSLKFLGGVTKIPSRHQEEKFAGRRDDLLSGRNDEHEKIQSSENNFVENSGIQRKRFKSNKADFAVHIISEVDSYERQLLNKPLLQSLLKGDNPEVAFSVRQLFIGSSAILSLKLQIYGGNFSSSLMPIPIGISQFLLTEFAEMVEEPHSFSYVWLDGVLKYLEVLGSYISSTNSTSSKNVYARLIDMHLRAIGRCISLQGKGATLASHETESSTKTLLSQIGSSKLSLGHGHYSLDEFKARLRMSFKVLIKKPLELHLLTAVEALESALVGVHERCSMIYEINTGGPDGGKVSPIVAAGVDCFDLVLESVSGPKLLNVLKEHIQSLIGALFNIVLHLQSPLIYYEKLTCNTGDIGPDPGAVILMCVEVLTKVAGKPALFRMDSSHVVQSLRVPAALFQDFCHLRSSESPSSSSMLSANQALTPVAGMLTYIVDQHFSVDLFAACCRLLSTVLRHHTIKSGQCISFLQDSVCVLLHCLETRDTELVDRKGYYAWEVQEGIKCASFLRRIYEEIRQRKEDIGWYTSHFLSNYIWVYSGYGPSKTGIRREIDEALRPGVYALVDACSPDDLQHLHKVLGEGPSRSTLATLQHDYKLNFKYEGKV
ncbi:Nucleolar 27S pre-rRNA processing [Macleaya cordata]|uniref:Nucleolar 27S pre-rRNA processing n=1 Tax=Macleaya cordata TaxID=56857 RepID=A0A200Q387_MACCD|nr:Nucleolar 27S pre-rRNA processing [Macleaya cordata]